MPCFINSYATYLVRPNDPSTEIGSLCLRAYLSILLVHPKGGRPRDARVVTSYTGMVLGYAGSFGYDRTPRCDWGRRQVVTAMSVRRNSCVAFSVFPNVQVQCRSSCKEVMGLDVLQCGTFSLISHFPSTLLALLKYPFYPLFILDNGMNSISKSLTVLTPA